MKKKKIMILGASILQLPAILKAKEMGLEVIAVDIDRNAIGFKYSDVNLEISTLDIPKIIEAAKQYNIDGVLTLASDMPMRTVAAVSSELNIVGISNDTAIKTTNKVIMRESLKQHDVPIPEFYKVKDYDGYISAIQNFTDEFIVKPADNSGSRGVFLVRDKNDMEVINYAYKYSERYSRIGDIIIEEYMKGPEVSVESLSVEGEVNIIAITDKITTGAPNFVEMCHSQPTRLPDEVKKEIEIITIDAVKAVGIKNGPAHTEIIVTNDGPKIVELGARLGGDNITTHLVPLSTGVDLVKCCIEVALGEKPYLRKTINMASAIQYLKTPLGRISKISGVNEASLIPDVKQVSIVKNIGDNVSEINSSTDRVGFVIAQSKDTENAISACQKAISKIDINVVSVFSS